MLDPQLSFPAQTKSQKYFNEITKRGFLQLRAVGLLRGSQWLIFPQLNRNINLTKFDIRHLVSFKPGFLFDLLLKCESC